uniref:Uncharacterized protein n=1 Tax=Sphaerodactylus townsendi TaxID=933632 RepID=A0ACB8G4J9_9SAUR
MTLETIDYKMKEEKRRRLAEAAAGLQDEKMKLCFKFVILVLGGGVPCVRCILGEKAFGVGVGSRRRQRIKRVPAKEHLNMASLQVHFVTSQRFQQFSVDQGVHTVPRSLKCYTLKSSSRVRNHFVG